MMTKKMMIITTKRNLKYYKVKFCEISEVKLKVNFKVKSPDVRISIKNKGMCLNFFRFFW